MQNFRVYSSMHTVDNVAESFTKLGQMRLVSKFKTSCPDTRPSHMFLPPKVLSSLLQHRSSPRLKFTKTNRGWANLHKCKTSKNMNPPNKHKTILWRLLPVFFSLMDLNTRSFPEVKKFTSEGLLRHIPKTCSNVWPANHLLSQFNKFHLLDRPAVS